MHKVQKLVRTVSSAITEKYMPYQRVNTHYKRVMTVLCHYKRVMFPEIKIQQDKSILTMNFAVRMN